MLSPVKIGKRGVLFSFDEINHSTFGNKTTNVYAIIGKDNFYICDTYMGPSFMQEVRSYLVENFGKKSFIVINSHAHWDHIFGNSAFRSDTIIAHTSCYDSMVSEYASFTLESFEKELAQYNFRLPERKIEIVFPTLTFQEEICFIGDNLKVFHSPGHRYDCISVYDIQDNVLFAGDNVEKPHPTYIDFTYLRAYTGTLIDYMLLEPDIIIPGHDEILSFDDLFENLKYIKGLKQHMTKNKSST